MNVRPAIAYHKKCRKTQFYDGNTAIMAKMHSNHFVFVVFTILALSYVSCQEADVWSRVNPSVLRVGNGAEPADLDPHLVSGVTEHVILSKLFEGLVNLDARTLQPMPGVAESWELSPDGREYTFHLRRSARWSNGDPVTAEDFAYAWRRILTPSLGSEYAHMLHCIQNARLYNEGKLEDFSHVGVRVLDPYTLQVVLEYPTPYFLSMQIHFTYFPVHRGTIERFGRMDERGTQWTRAGNFVGNGAFQLDRWEPDRILVVKRNPYYWNASEVSLNEIQFYPIDNLNTEELLFRVGRLDLTSTVPLNKVEPYQRNYPEKIHISPYLGTYFYRFNTKRRPFDDVRVRRAFSLAINRDDLVRNVVRAGRAPAFSLTPKGIENYIPPESAPFNPEEARRLLAQAGYPEGVGFPPVEILFNTSEDHRQVAEAIQAMWRENLGIRVGLRNQDWKVYLNSLSTLDYDIARSAWIGDVIDPVNFLECFTSGNGNNRTGFSSPIFDGLIEQARSASSVSERFERLREAEKVLLEEAPIAPLYFYTRVFLKEPRVEGVYPNLLGYLDFKHVFWNIK